MSYTVDINVVIFYFFIFFRRLIKSHKIDLIAIGNGTASRETEVLICDIIKKTKIQYLIVNEAGASVYSTSKTAQKEFPNLEASQVKMWFLCLVKMAWNPYQNFYVYLSTFMLCICHKYLLFLSFFVSDWNCFNRQTCTRSSRGAL